MTISDKLLGIQSFWGAAFLRVQLESFVWGFFVRVLYQLLACLINSYHNKNTRQGHAAKAVQPHPWRVFSLWWIMIKEDNSIVLPVWQILKIAPQTKLSRKTSKTLIIQIILSNIIITIYAILLVNEALYLVEVNWYIPIKSIYLIILKHWMTYLLHFAHNIIFCI